MIRNAKPDDYETFAKLFRELAVEDPVPTVDRFCEDFMPTVLIAEFEGDAKGYAFYRPMKESVHLMHLVTAPEARGEGHAPALLTEVARRAASLGCKQMTLNVKVDNTRAIHVYERFGLHHSHRNHGLKLPWALVEARRDEVSPLAARAREIAPAEDAALEAEWRLPPGILAEQRARPGRVLRAITTESGKNALVVFDVGFPGTNPLRAPDLRHAWALLLAVRPFAAPEQDSVHVLVEDQAAIAEGLIAAGATSKLVATFMRGPLPR